MIQKRETNITALAMIRLLNYVQSDLQPSGPAGSPTWFRHTPPPVLGGTRWPQGHLQAEARHHKENRDWNPPFLRQAELKRGELNTPTPPSPLAPTFPVAERGGAEKLISFRLLNIRITWSAFSLAQFLSSITDQFNQNFGGCVWSRWF